MWRKGGGGVGEGGGKVEARFCDSVLVVWPTLAKTDFGQTEFDLCCVCLCVFVLCGVGVGFTVSVPPGTVLPRTALPLDRPKFRSFFPLPPQNSFFSSLSGGLLVEFRWWFEDENPQMCTFGLSGCRVKPWRLRGRRGFTRQPENSKRALLSAPALQTPPKFHEKDPREGRKERILWREREKKTRNFGPPTFRAPPFAPTHTKKPKQLISKNQNNQLPKTKIFAHNKNLNFTQSQFGQSWFRPLSNVIFPQAGRWVFAESVRLRPSASRLSPSHSWR